MIINNFVAYVKQVWRNKPDTSTPLSADRLMHLEDGIKGNSDAIEKLAAAVVSQIVNDPNKIASMAALFSVNQRADGLSTRLDQLNSDISKLTTDVGGSINLSNNNYIYYRKKGNEVEVVVSIQAPVTFSGSPYKFGQLPVGYRPPSTRYIVPYGATALIQILTSGDIVTFQGVTNSVLIGNCTYGV